MFLRRIWCKIVKTFKFLPQDYYVRHYYEYYSGKKLDYNNLQEFNQKISWYKVFYRNPILPKLVDKYAVREFVIDKIGSQYLNDCLGIYISPEKINWDSLPNQFVIKGTHGCNFNLIVSDKSKLDKRVAILKMKKWLNKNQYYRGGLEWAYKDVQPRLIVEKFLIQGEGNSSLIDYKFYCFDGEMKFLSVHTDRDVDHNMSFFDSNFVKLPFTKDWSANKKRDKVIVKPQNLEKMIELSEILSEGFPFVRVDFYSIKEKIIFGEMTFYPSDARSDFYPEKYNRIIGDYFKIPNQP